MGWGKEDLLSSVASSNKIKYNGHKLKYREFH